MQRVESQQTQTRILFEGALSFENQGFINSWKQYWAQIIEERFKGSNNEEDLSIVSFRVLRGKKKPAGELKEKEIKRTVKLFNDEDPLNFVMPKIDIKKKSTDFTMIPNEEVSYNLRAESSGVRDQWLKVLEQYSTDTQGDKLQLSQISVGKHAFEEKLMHYKDYGLSEPLVTDMEMIRVAIPGDQAVKVNLKMVAKLMKELVGKDLSRFAMPVFVNEPTSILQKPAEIMYHNYYFTNASREPDSAKRMLLVAVNMISANWFCYMRMGKPFNPLLGETYELVTPKFKYFSEAVSHHPPICAFVCQGENYEFRRTMDFVQKFNGKSVKVYDNNIGIVEINLEEGIAGKDRQTEVYQYTNPMIVAGNFIVGEKYIEPQGDGRLWCDETGDVAEMQFNKRGFVARKDEENFCFCIIKNKEGQECYSIEGKYTEKLTAKNLQTGEEWIVYQAPIKPPNHEVMYQMNIYSLQLTHMNDQLKEKLPPTDCRLRGDLTYWDKADLKMASDEKVRLENNQRDRRNKVKELIKNDPEKQEDWDIHDERTFYKPTFFNKVVTVDAKGNKKYDYAPKKGDNKEYDYWVQRDSGKWYAPQIYEDDCEPYY